MYRQAPTAFCRGKIGVVSIVLVAASAKLGCIDYGAESKPFSFGCPEGYFLFGKRKYLFGLTAGDGVAAAVPCPRRGIFTKRRTVFRQSFLILRILLLCAVIRHNDAAVRLGADGERRDKRRILQRGVDDMALVGVHRLERDVAAVLCHFARNLLRQTL